MLKFSRRKTNSKSDDRLCSQNGCVGGRNGEQVWPSGAQPVCVNNLSDEDCVSGQRKLTSSFSAPCHIAQNKATSSRRTKPLNVLHVIRDKLKPSSKSRQNEQTECMSPNAGYGVETAQDCCTLTTRLSDSVDDILGNCCSQNSCTNQCVCDAVEPASVEECSPGANDSSEVLEVMVANGLSNCTDELTIADSADKSALGSNSVADFRCTLVKPQPIHGGLVLSQLSNIVPMETCTKNEQLYGEGASRLPLSPLSDSDTGLSSADDYHPVKWTLANELLRLSRYGWYWGPVSREEAEEKLAGQPEGAFLVRDSTDDRYLFSLSFRSSGRTLHTRVEYCNGEFSFYAQPRSDSYRSMAELIEQCVAESQSGVYCYSRGTSGVGSQSYPVKLTRPVSRFAQVRSLQYLCRFVIRQHTRVDHIQNLPLPVSVKGWLKENQY